MVDYDKDALDEQKNEACTRGSAEVEAAGSAKSRIRMDTLEFMILEASLFHACRIRDHGSFRFGIADSIR